MSSTGKGSIREEASVAGLKVIVMGAIDEFIDFADITLPKAGTLELDLGGVNRCNSMGVLRWARFLKGVPNELAIKLVNCSPIVVKQLNIFPALFAHPGLHVESFHVTFACGDCNQTRDVLLKTTTLTSGTESVALPKPPVCGSCGNAMELEELAEKQFMFLRRKAPTGV